MDTYVWEKMHDAVRSLTGTVSQRERLQNACLYSIHLLDRAEFPSQRSAKMYAELMETLRSGKPKADEGLILASIKQMDDRQVQETIDLIISIYDDVLRYMKPIK